MNPDNPLQPTSFWERSKDRIVFMLVLVAFLWAVEIVDYVISGIQQFDLTPEYGVLDQYGIRPKELRGLWGIFCAPFLHQGWGHLIGNTIPFFVLGLLVLLSGIRRFVAASFVIAVFGGLGTWLLGSGGLHIGASGLIFGYLGYVLSRGFFRRSLAWITIGLVVGAFYFWMIKGLFHVEEGVSWTGHFFGFAGGILAAWLFARKGS